MSKDTTPQPPADAKIQISAGAADGAEAGPPETQAEGKSGTTPVALAYADASRVVASPEAARVALFGNQRRDPIRIVGTLKNPLAFREAMSALYAVIGSDYRYVPKDRTAYTAYMRMRRESEKLGVWKSQQAYFAWVLRNDPQASFILDPLLSVHADGLLLEVFSKDEGTYAALNVSREAFDLASELVPGTTTIDFSQSLFDGLQQLRGYRPTRLTLTKEADAPTDPPAAAPAGTEGKTGAAPGGGVLEKQIRVPDSWLRGFLQVQSAAALPMDRFSVAPIDLYNLLRHLRLHRDRKGQRRGLRVELVPGERPRLVLEPWEVVLNLGAEAYKGTVPKVVRIWGRRRLMLPRRMLPFVDALDVHVLGSGLPSFWVFRAGPLTLTVGLTGFTSANWSQAVSFDLLLPRKTQGTAATEAVLKHLGRTRQATPRELSEATGLKGANLVEAVQVGCGQGRLMYDLAAGVYRLRPVAEAPLDLQKLEYRNQRERVAHDLLVRRGAVKVVSQNRVPGNALELIGRVAVEEDKREYRPQMLLADEGQVSRAECTCTFFRKQGLKAGPCVHLIALRLAYARQEAQRLASGDSRQTVTVETRLYSKRDEAGEDVVQVSLERQRLKVRWGRSGGEMRLQTLRYNTAEEARTAYFGRIDQLDAGGYLDATAGSA